MNLRRILRDTSRKFHDWFRPVGRPGSLFDSIGTRGLADIRELMQMCWQTNATFLKFSRERKPGQRCRV
jgi:hypothetical protein